MWMVGAYQRTHGQVGWFGLRVGSHLALSLHSSNEPGELPQWPCRDVSTIDIVISILISTIIIITFHMSRRRRETYCGHARLCVCVSVCLSAATCLHYCTDPDVTWGVVGNAP